METRANELKRTNDFVSLIHLHGLINIGEKGIWLRIS